MKPDAFEADDGTSLSAVSATEMRSIDRLATEEAGLALLSMMENAGRNLATAVRDRRDDRPVVVYAGAGGNGGGGLACARHLANRQIPVTVVLDREPTELSGATERQYRVLDRMDVPVHADVPSDVRRDALAVDAIVGYGLSGPLEGRAADLAEECSDAPIVVSLDVPSGVDATTGKIPGAAVTADATLTLALPKTGLGPNAGELLLGDIGIPAAVYAELEIPYRTPFAEAYVVPIDRIPRRPPAPDREES